MRITLAIGFLMVDAVGRDPEDRTAFERQRPAEGEEVLDPLRRLVPPMRQEPVVAHADAQHPAGVIENECGEHRAGIHVEEGRHGADVKPGHGDCGNPVQAGLMFAAIEKHRGRH